VSCSILRPNAALGLPEEKRGERGSVERALGVQWWSRGLFLAGGFGISSQLGVKIWHFILFFNLVGRETWRRIEKERERKEGGREAENWRRRSREYEKIMFPLCRLCFIFILFSFTLVVTRKILSFHE